MNKQYKVNKRESRQIKDDIWTKMPWPPDTIELQTLTRAVLLLLLLPEPKLVPQIDPSVPQPQP